MNAQVVDRNGAEIRVGSVVQRPGFKMRGTVRGINWLGDGEVYVSWPDQRYGFPFRSRRRFTARRSYRCSDLVVAPVESREGAEKD